MFVNKKHLWLRSSRVEPWVVRPVLELLDGRESPSALQPAGLLAPLVPESVGFASVLAVEPASESQAPQPAVLTPTTNLAVPGVADFGPATGFAAKLPPLDMGPAVSPVFAGDPAGGSLLITMSPRQASPTIFPFTASEGTNGWWTFQGSVEASAPKGLTVHFDGLPTLHDQAADVQDDGKFALSLQLPNGEEGMATAQTTDWDGHVSNLAEAYVHQTNGGK